ncbi:MAG: hypothetical protein ACLGH0_14970, partial [Thermoanaerobaculia bacterium]
MILYRKSPQLRVRRAPAPEPPFFAATAIAPYGAKRAAPVSIDYLAMHASGAERAEVTVCEDVRKELERGRALSEPVLIDAAETAEMVFRRGEEALAFCEERGLATLHLISTRGTLPQRAYEHSTVVIAAWPLELPRLEALFAEAVARGVRFGVAVPVIYPVTTELAALDALADAARGASFLAALGVAVEPTAKQALTQSLQLDDEQYATLFHAALEPLHI